jgi:hypothetical protein
MLYYTKVYSSSEIKAAYDHIRKTFSQVTSDINWTQFFDKNFKSVTIGFDMIGLNKDIVRLCHSKDLSYCLDEYGPSRHVTLYEFLSITPQTHPEFFI